MKVKDAPVVGHESICDPADADRAAASIRSAVYGSKRVDHMGDFNVEGGKQNLSLKAIHVSLAPLATPSGDPFEGLGQPVYFTLESECGEMADVRNCSESISSTWHFGVVFKYEGGLYFAGTPEVGVERGALVDQPVQKALSLHGHHEADGGRSISSRSPERHGRESSTSVMRMHRSLRVFRGCLILALYSASVPSLVQP